MREREQDKLRILVTGFEPFGGAASNPSGDVARVLHGQTVRESVIVGRILPVVWDEAPRLLEDWLDELRPNVVIALGMAREAIAIEMVATNRRHPERRDNHGRFPVPNRPIATQSFPTALPVEAITRALASDGGIQMSKDAGGFLCEEVFYALQSARARVLSAKQWPLLISGFIHVPNDRFITNDAQRNRLEKQIYRIIEATVDEIVK